VTLDHVKTFGTMMDNLLIDTVDTDRKYIPVPVDQPTRTANVQYENVLQGDLESILDLLGQTEEGRRNNQPPPVITQRRLQQQSAQQPRVVRQQARPRLLMNRI
jgi:hypothetical protein